MTERENLKQLFTGFILLLLMPAPARATGVVINEFLPNPSSGNSEWTEFYNSDQSSVDLSDYYFDDDTSFSSDSGSSTKIAISGLLPSLSTCYITLSTFLNNNGDAPTLFKTDGSTIDTYQYTQTTVDKSYARIPDGGDWQTNQIPTKSSTLCADLAPSPTPTPIPPTATPTPVPTSTIAPTDVPTPSPTPTTAAIATTIPTVKPTVRPTPTGEPLVLGEETSEPTVPETIHEAAENQTSPTFIEKFRSLIPVILIVVGAALTIGSGVPLVIQKIRGRRKLPPV